MDAEARAFEIGVGQGHQADVEIAPDKQHQEGHGGVVSARDGVPNGESGFDAFVFALQQPFPGLIWRADLAVLYDIKGGVLIQPGVKWRPRDNVQLDVYANIISSNGGNNDVMQTFETMDELFARMTWYF